MHSSATTKVATTKLLGATLGALSIALFASGCLVIKTGSDDDSSSSGTSPTGPSGPSSGSGSSGPIVEVNIDAGEGMILEPGDGVGAFVEYDGNGVYALSTTCDTNHSGYRCNFDIFLDAAGLRVISTAGLEYDDRVVEGFDQVDLSLRTSTDIDGVRLQTDPGALLRLELFLDQRSEPRFIYWIGDGILNEGAPSNPVDFVPVDNPIDHSESESEEG